MSFQDLASELVHQIYNSLSTVSDVINLSLSCRRFSTILRNSQKMTTLFAAADREFGPIEDIKMLVTYTHTQPAHVKRDPPLSYSLLRQIMSVGLIAKRVEQLYPSTRWESGFIHRRSLTQYEAYRVRRAVYRYWLYCEAFHNRNFPRTQRLHRAAVEERMQLLRSWSTEELIEVEDIRSVLEEILSSNICPSDGLVRHRVGSDSVMARWPFSSTNCIRIQPVQQREHLHSLFHDPREELSEKIEVLLPEDARTSKMEGWGDEISQYYIVQSMLKLNPAQIVGLYDHAIYKWQVEAVIHGLGEDWFWNNGQTFSDTWALVLHSRGLEVEGVRTGVLDGILGVAVNDSEWDCVI